MNLLLISEIREGLTPPAFGGEFTAHIEQKTNPAVRAASLTAWNLLAEGLGRMGYAEPGQEGARLRDVAPEGVASPWKTRPSSQSLEGARGEKDSAMLKSAAGLANMPLSLNGASDGKDFPPLESVAGFGKMSPPPQSECERESASPLESAAGPGRIPMMPEATPDARIPMMSESMPDARIPMMPESMPDARILPAVRFGEAGKPEFADCPLHFSLAHSGKLAVALLSSSPCGVDVERIRPEVDERLRARCLSPEEQRLGMDFFECWVKKECVGKLTGHGIDAHPGKIDTLDARWSGRFFFETLTDSTGQSYALAALCEGAEEIGCSIVRI